MSTSMVRPRASGGIAKRSGPSRVRLDRDGDLDMDAPASGAARGNRRGNNRARDSGSRRGASGVSGRGISGIAPTGQSADRGASGSTRGKDTRRDPVGTRSRNSAASSQASRPTGVADGPLVEIKVYGWKESKGSAEECVRFLERKSRLRLNKTKKQGEYVSVWVPLGKVQEILDWDNALFASSHLRISAPALPNIDASISKAPLQSTPKSKEAADTIKMLECVLANRYDYAARFLNLSKLGEDALLRENGFFELDSTTSKMFPAMMRVADKKFASLNDKKDAVHSVTLGNNNLKDIRAVTTLSVTFPDLKNLSLENNLIEDWRGLDNWKSRFRNLEQLVLTGNPITNLRGYKEEALRRWPSLTMLDNVFVGKPKIEIGNGLKTAGGNIDVDPMAGAVTDEGVPVLPLPVKGNFLVDPAGLVFNFLSTFFPMYDNDREAALAAFYDNNSTVSLSVNVSAPRELSQQGERQYWDAYIPKSRNLTRVTHLRGVIERLAYGTAEIRSLWAELTTTKHPMGNEALWSFDSWPIELGEGVGGMLVTVHGQFEEMQEGKLLKRSFDRTFTLGVANNGTEVRVANDMMTLRAYGGSEAWKEQVSTRSWFGNEEEVKQQKRNEMHELTGLRMEWVELCMTEVNWDWEAAGKAFIDAQNAGQLPKEAFETNLLQPPQ